MVNSIVEEEDNMQESVPTGNNRRSIQLTNSRSIKYSQDDIVNTVQDLE